MWVEITEKAFNKLVTSDDCCYHTNHQEVLDNKEHCYKIYYKVCDGLHVMSINNYLTGIKQYFVEDINA